MSAQIAIGSHCCSNSNDPQSRSGGIESTEFGAGGATTPQGENWNRTTSSDACCAGCRIGVVESAARLTPAANNTPSSSTRQCIAARVLSFSGLRPYTSLSKSFSPRTICSHSGICSIRSCGSLRGGASAGECTPLLSGSLTEISQYAAIAIARSSTTKAPVTTSMTSSIPWSDEKFSLFNRAGAISDLRHRT